MNSHPLDAALTLQALAPGRYAGHTSADYWNMVGPFGGYTAATLLAAVLKHPDLLGTPVSFTVNYAAAVAEGDYEVQVFPARTNRSTQHWTAAIVQNGDITTTATVFTALRRDTWAANDMPMPHAPMPDLTQRPANMTRPVEWVNRYDMRFVEGFFPPAWDGKEYDSSRTRLWVRDEPPRALDFPALLALCDVFYPRIWRRRATMTPAGTVSMTVYFHATPDMLQRTGNAHVLAQAQAQAFGGNYFDQSAQVWNAAGELLATSHQIVYYKE